MFDQITAFLIALTHFLHGIAAIIKALKSKK